MTPRPDRIHAGDHITYRGGTTLAWNGSCQRGRVLASPIADPYTAALWFPTHPDDAREDANPDWIRQDRVIDVGPSERNPTHGPE